MEVDGRKQMALRHQRQLAPAARRRGGSEQQCELAQRIGHPASLLAPYRQSSLERLRREDAHRARREIIAFKAQLDSITADAGAS